KFPVFYPVTREQRAETGSLVTAFSSDRSADQPEHRDLAAALAVEPDGLAGYPRKSAGDPDRKFDPVCVAALSASGDRTTAGAEPVDPRLWGPCRHEGDARRGAGGALKGPGPTPPARGGASRNRTRRPRGRSSAPGAQPLQ